MNENEKFGPEFAKLNETQKAAVREVVSKANNDRMVRKQIDDKSEAYAYRTISGVHWGVDAPINIARGTTSS